MDVLTSSDIDPESELIASIIRALPARAPQLLAINLHRRRAQSPPRRPTRRRRPLSGFMDAYPTGLSTPVTQEGLPTPTHGGLVAGPEYDVPITQKPIAAQTPDRPDKGRQTSTMDRAERTERYAQPQARASSASQRPRPVSMPPQAYAPPTNGERDQRYEEGRHGRPEGSSSSKSRGGTRILGDYTLSKTLGAGSMGKVKLAHHNITGEKVSSCRTQFQPSGDVTLSPARGQNSPPSRPQPCRSRAHVRCGCETGVERCLEGDTDAP